MPQPHKSIRFPSEGQLGADSAQAYREQHLLIKETLEKALLESQPSFCRIPQGISINWTCTF